VFRLHVLATAAVLAAACGGAHDHSAAQRHRHYFLVGKRACRHVVKRTANSASLFLLDLNSYPAAYRDDVARGCAADR
jgi:hypothetical protein